MVRKIWYTIRVFPIESQMNHVQKEKVIIESRVVKHRDVNKIKRNTWITLAILGFLTILSFSYLMYWLFAKEADKASTNLPIAAVPPVSSGAAGGKNETVPKDVPNTVPNAPTNVSPNDAAGNGAQSSADKPADSTANNGQVPGDTSAASGTSVNANGNADTGSGTSTNNAGVKLTFVGDVMFAGNVEELLKRNGWDYPYRYMKEYLEKADITIANLETPISTRGTAQTKEYVYRSSSAALPALKDAGIDLVNTANNHILDYGVDALLDTMEALDKADIKRVGTGNNSEEAYKPVIIERNGMRIAFLGFSRNVPDNGWFASKKPGVAETYTTKLPLEAITQAREEADLVVVIAHWGVERSDVPVKEQTDLAHQYIDSGADLVVASHPHVLQGFEQYKGKWIAYSLGNFIFTTNAEPATWETMVLDAVCTKDRNCELQMLPVLTKGAQPVRMPELEGAKLMERMTRISFNARVEKDGKVVTAPAKNPVSEVAPAVKAPAAVKTDDKKAGTTAKPAQSTQPTKPAAAVDKPSTPASTQQSKPSAP
jgi:poly-gamma-glutamate capsule biosynthesis protein CapA/YwtB (metallophosphatase superfamily)